MQSNKEHTNRQSKYFIKSYLHQMRVSIFFRSLKLKLNLNNMSPRKSKSNGLMMNKRIMDGYLRSTIFASV